jgi:hypothetical protein
MLSSYRIRLLVQENHFEYELTEYFRPRSVRTKGFVLDKSSIVSTRNRGSSNGCHWSVGELPRVSRLGGQNRYIAVPRIALDTCKYLFDRALRAFENLPEPVIGEHQGSRNASVRIAGSREAKNIVHHAAIPRRAHCFGSCFDTRWCTQPGIRPVSYRRARQQLRARCPPASFQDSD